MPLTDGFGGVDRLKSSNLLVMIHFAIQAKYRDVIKYHWGISIISRDVTFIPKE